MLLTAQALAELFFKDFREPVAFSWPPEQTHPVQLGKSTERERKGAGRGCASLSLCSPGLLVSQCQEWHGDTGLRFSAMATLPRPSSA